MAFAAFYFRSGLPLYLQIPAYVIIGVMAFYLFRWIGSIIKIIIDHLPLKYLSIILAAIGVFLLARYMRLSWPQGQIDFTLGALISGAVLMGGSLYSIFKKQGSTSFCITMMLLGLACFLAPVYNIISSGDDPYIVDFEPISSTNLDNLGLQNPGVLGAFEVEYFTYGSGENERRPEFGKDAQYVTPTVDASLLLLEWTGKRKKWRERFWGFGIDEAPINGRVWMPQKAGKLPLILIVHGNHGMEHFSDPGYEYLGELLASRGFITVSVDENYINGTWSGDFRGKEMPIRAWLLLKHLEQWNNWSKDESSDFYERADLSKVILIGHSRGGEAVSIAAKFNELKYFPDNSNVAFDFNFGIKGIVTIAPTDQRYFRRIELKDLNYLSLQGSYDADEASFFGLRQYQRVTFSDSTDYFKAGVLIHKANHGQFNSIWGRRDFGEPSGWFLNTGPLITGEEQRQIAKVYIGAFAERIFNNQQEYNYLFQNYASAKNWLPETTLLNNYVSSTDSVLVDFEEDIDLGSATSGSIEAKNFLVWHEEPLMMRGGETQGTNATILGWDNDSIQSISSYQVTLNEPFSVSKSDDFIFSIGRANDSNLKIADTLDVDFTIQFITTLNDTISTTLSSSKKLAPKLRVKYMKLDKMNGSFGGNWELAMETVSIPNENFSIEDFEVRAIQFVFDQSKKGLIALDNIGFRRNNSEELLTPQ